MAAKKMNSVVHFEMPYKNAKRASKFYEKVFGWVTNSFGEDFGNYITVSTGPTNEKTQMVKKPGFINGGLYPQSASPKYKEPSVVISVADMEKHMKVVVKSGGKILRKPQDIPGIGKWVSFRDPEGNRVSMLQPVRP